MIGSHAGKDNNLSFGNLFRGGYVDEGVAEGCEGVADGTDVAGSVVEEGDG